jgi:hypothetical protein
MTRDELLRVVYTFYPRGLIAADGTGYDYTEEILRQRDAARRGATEYPRWQTMLDGLGTRYLLMDRTAEGRDPAYSAHVHLPEQTLGFHVSLLGRYYGIHRLTGSAAEAQASSDLAREIEATYPGYEPIPSELGDEVVPDVTLDATPFGQATIYICLLSEVWRGSSETLPPPTRPPRTEAERARLERLWAKYPHTRIVPPDEAQGPERRK